MPLRALRVAEPIEYTAAAAYHRLIVGSLVDDIGHAQTRGEVMFAGIPQRGALGARWPRFAGSFRVGRGVEGMTRVFARRRIVIPAQAVVQRQARS